VRPLLALVLLAACGPAEVTVEGARLATADKYEAAPPGTTIVLPGGVIPDKLSGVVRLAPDREVGYDEVRAAVQKIRDAGGQPVVLVSRREDVVAFPATPAKEGVAIRVRATTEGKACVSPPDNEEATCIARKDQKRIDRAFVRQILRKATQEYDLKRINVVIEPGLPWSDAVRAIDGARTCCERDDLIVSVEPPL
jgi:hypothetical protein